MNRSFVTLPEMRLRLNLATVVSVQDCGKFASVTTLEVTSTESGYPCAQTYNVWGDDDRAILDRALDRLDVLNEDTVKQEGQR